MSNEDVDLNQVDYSNYCIRVGENIYEKIDRHVRVLKKVDNPIQSKQKWLNEAIREKLEVEIDLPLEGISKDKHINIKIANHIRRKVEKRVGLTKKFRSSYSMKQWVMEAIFEKLDRDAERPKRLLEEISNTID